MNEKIYNIKHIEYAIFPEKKPLRLLTEPPFTYNNFKSRTVELNEVRGHLLDGQQVILIVNGQGGIGKTAFASRYWYQYEGQYSHLAYLYTGSDISNSLLKLAKSLFLEFPLKMKKKQRLSELIRNIACLEKPCLLVLDNVDDEQELDKYLPQLESCRNFHILITSRLSKYQDYLSKKIKPLEKSLALQLFKDYYQELDDSETIYFDILYNIVDGNTLVLELLAKNLSSINSEFENRYYLSQLIDDIQNNLLNLSQSTEVRTKYHSKNGFRKEKPEAIIEAMYNISTLDEAQQIILINLSVLPPEPISVSILYKLLPPFQLKRELGVLSKKGWIEHEGEYIKISPVIQEICRKKRGEYIWSDCKLLVNKQMELLKFDGFYIESNNYREASLVANFTEFTLKYIKEVNVPIASVYNKLGMFYYTLGNLDKSNLLFKKYNALSNQLLLKNPTDLLINTHLATSYSRLGEIQKTIGNYKEALSLFQQKYEMENILYKQNPTNIELKNDIAVSFLKIGEVYCGLEKNEIALQYFIKFNNFEKQINKAFKDSNLYKNNFAVSYLKLGEIYILTNNNNEALRCFKQYKNLKNELYLKNSTNGTYKNGLAISFSKLGETFIILGKANKALTFFKKYYLYEKELYEDYPEVLEYKNGFAYANDKLGDYYSKINSSKSLNYYLKAKQLWLKLIEKAPRNIEYQKNINLIDLKVLALNKA